MSRNNLKTMARNRNLELGHFIADGRRRKPKVIMLCQPLRANRLSRFDVITDDQQEQGLLTFGKFVHGIHIGSTLASRVLPIRE